MLEVAFIAAARCEGVSSAPDVSESESEGDGPETVDEEEEGISSAISASLVPIADTFDEDANSVCSTSS